MPWILLAALLFFLSIGSRGFLRQVEIRRQKRRIEREISALKEQIERLEGEKKRLMEPEEIERIAREAYGMARENETVYQIVPREASR